MMPASQACFAYAQAWNSVAQSHTSIRVIDFRPRVSTGTHYHCLLKLKDRKGHQACFKITFDTKWRASGNAHARCWGGAVA